MEIQSIRGFKDILPDEAELRHKLELKARDIFRCFGFREINTPIVERTELFSRSIGEGTDIVSKEMYSFQDLKGRSITLRPEATATVVRAYIQNRLYSTSPVQKLFTIGPMFRYERPQRGRFRQFYQINAELIGDPGPISDAEIINMAMKIINSFGINGFELDINSLGCPDCRGSFRNELRIYLEGKLDELCSNCKSRIDLNPLRVFDCKVEGCREAISEAPSILDFICEECKIHFDGLRELLTLLGTSHKVNHKLVRGLDYYTRTTFEILVPGLGAQNAVAGGGRYDGLVKLLGGPDTPAMGFAIGIDRVMEVLREDSVNLDMGTFIYLIPLGEEARKRCFLWLDEIRSLGIRAEMLYEAKGLKAQMKRADKAGAAYALIVGDQELEEGVGILRNMSTGEQKRIQLDDLANNIKREILKS